MEVTRAGQQRDQILATNLAGLVVPTWSVPDELFQVQVKPELGS